MYDFSTSKVGSVALLPAASQYKGLTGDSYRPGRHIPVCISQHADMNVERSVSVPPSDSCRISLPKCTAVLRTFRNLEKISDGRLGDRVAIQAVEQDSQPSAGILNDSLEVRLNLLARDRFCGSRVSFPAGLGSVRHS
jgi:hypothetical protein